MRAPYLSGRFKDFGLPRAIRTDNGIPFCLPECPLRFESALRVVVAPRDRH